MAERRARIQALAERVPAQVADTRVNPGIQASLLGMPACDGDHGCEIENLGFEGRRLPGEGDGVSTRAAADVEEPAHTGGADGLDERRGAQRGVPVHGGDERNGPVVTAGVHLPSLCRFPGSDHLRQFRPGCPEGKVVLESGADVIGGAFDEVASRHRSVSEEAIAFGEQAQGDQGVEENPCGARVRSEGFGQRLGGGLRGARHGREDPELDGRQQDTARHVSSGLLGKVIGNDAGRLARLEHGHGSAPVQSDLSLERPLVGAQEAPDGVTLLEVLGHDLGDVLRADVRVPDALRVDHQVRSVLAHAQGAAGRHGHGFREASGGDLAAQRLDHRRGTARGAAGRALGLSLIADEHVVTEGMQGGSPCMSSRRLTAIIRQPAHAPCPWRWT